MLLVKTAIITLGEKPVMAIPNAVPPAGGCSTSSATIKQIAMPTASENTRIEGNIDWCGIKAHSEPEIRPTIWPPITLLGLAVMFLGMVNTIKAVAPIDAMTTACSMDRSKSTINTTAAARKLW